MGTLVQDPFYERVPAFFGITFDELLEQKHPRAWIEFELGHIDESTFFQTFFADSRGFDHEGLKTAMVDGYAWLPGMEDLVGELADAGVPMHTLSNYTPWFELIEQRTGISRFLRWTFVSCTTGVRKPDPEAYLGAARVLNVNPADCLFIDDRKRNCDGAEAVGMTSILFESAAQLRSALVARGLL